MLNGTISVEEISHHFQTREVLTKIINKGLIKLLDFPYMNKSKDITIHQYEIFDDVTKKFVSHYKQDIQKINSGDLSIRKFKRKVGHNNYALFAQTANFCINDTNIIPPSSQYFTNLTSNYVDIIYPDKSKYIKIGNEVLEEMKETSNKRSKFLEKTRKIATMDILNIGKSLEYKLQNKQKEIMNGRSR